jgi:hypothetical protein
MSNIIPPMVPSSPPPMDDAMEDDEDDEFGDFAAAADLPHIGGGDRYCSNVSTVKFLILYYCLYVGQLMVSYFMPVWYPTVHQHNHSKLPLDHILSQLEGVNHITVRL